jgi:hypothetical protein
MRRFLFDAEFFFLAQEIEHEHQTTPLPAESLSGLTQSPECFAAQRFG